MKNYLLLSILGFALVSCSGNDDDIISACAVNNPAEDLEWLKAEIERRRENPTDDMKYCYIVQAQLNGQDVFIYEDCNPLINKAVFILNCEGIGINTQDNPTAFDQVVNKIIIWKGSNFTCQTSF